MFDTYLLTELRPSWGAAKCAATQELPRFLWNPKVQCSVNKSLPLVPILSHINAIHTIPPSLPLIHFIIVHLPMSWSSQWSLSFWISYHYPIHSSSPPFVLHAPPISSFLTSSFWLYLQKSASYEAPRYAVFSNLLSLHPSSVQMISTPCSQTHSVYVLPLMSETKFDTHIEVQEKQSKRHKNDHTSTSIFQVIMKMEAAGSSETMFYIYIITPLNLPEGSIFIITVTET
jgi:hypothetical protein